MTTAQLEKHQREMQQEPRPLRWTKEQYHRMGEMGLLQDKRVELVEGEIIEMAPMNAPHWTAVGLLGDALRRIFTTGFVVADQLPVSLINESEPEPDAAVIRGDWRDFKEALPSSAALVVEVSFSTLGYDQGDKMRLYARAAIAEYWIVDLNARQLIVHRQPDAANERYNFVQILNESETVVPVAAPQAAIAVADLLP